ncbi:MAG TPA: NosD domain-containing protein, partial [Acidimicrobiia bacterium]|nr:NosD domain-containing protein [Acidimicrobiia bacterium]
RLVGTATDFERLGWEDAHPGLLVGPGGRAAIHGGAMRGNHHGVTARGAERVDLRDVTVARSRGTGILLRGPCGTVALRGVVSRENAASGVKIDDACTGVAIDGASVNRNARSGIDVADSDGVSVRRAQVWDNETGVVLRGAAHATLAGSQVSANRSDGVLVNAPAGGVRVLRGRLDHNARAGIYLNQGQATVGRRTRIVSNETGVRVTDPTVVVSVADSLVTRNVKDGFSLVGAGGVTLTRNRVLDNGAAAFSVDVPGVSAPLLAGNRIDDAVTERVRSPETDPT